MGQLLLHLLLLHVLLSRPAACFDAVDAASSPSFLDLSVGLNLSMAPFYEPSSGAPFSLQSMFAVATPSLDAGGFFFPILSSPSFFGQATGSDSNASYQPSFGFSLGFYFLPLSYNYTIVSGELSSPCKAAGCTIYLALCGGTSGHYQTGGLPNVSLSGALSSSTSKIFPRLALDGFVTPVWIGNLDSPIHWADKASLTVEQAAGAAKGSSTIELQLRDGDKPVWRAAAGINNITGIMEIWDSGDLLIYGSHNKSHVVWHATTDTLIEGQSLTVGMELVSNDSSYAARMEGGGLVLFMKKAQPQELRPPLPYWVFPLFRDDQKSMHLSIKKLLLTAPCSGDQSSASVDVLRHGISPYNASGSESVGHQYIALYPGSCSSRKSFIEFSNIAYDRYPVSWSFMRLENDGKLYSYAVFHFKGNTTSFARIAFDSAAARFYADSKSSGFTPPFLEWRECDVPLACGPLGVCTPGARTACTCSLESHFEPVSATDFSQGCQRRTPLPLCSGGTNTHIGFADFVKLEGMASILLFSGWNRLNVARHAQADSCKQLCLSHCPCNGFFYQVDKSICSFIEEEISLLAVGDTTLYLIDYTSANHQNLTLSQSISAKNYATYLKVASAPQTSTQKVNVSLPLSPPPPTAHPKLGPPPLNERIIVICSATILVVGVALYSLREWHNKRIYNIMLAKEMKDLKDILPLLPYKFSFKELYDATRGFNKLLGKGGCGSVYAGVLSDGRKVAVKMLQVALLGTGQSKQFLAEVATVGRTGHQNIVRLIGFCWEATQRLLVYEFLERGSLDRWLFVKEPSMTPQPDTSTVQEASDDVLLSWKTRYNIALGIARGLSYLHEECEQPILHFDIKPQNILLGDEFEAKLADFGLSRLMQRDMSSVITGLRGTPGYIAPEWCSHGAIGRKSDVYSMGMVFLELVAGRPNLDFSLLTSHSDDAKEQASCWHLPTWGAQMCQEGQLMELVDKRLHVCGFDAEEACRLIYTAFWCILEEPAMRPYASTVVQWLECQFPVEQPPFSMVMNVHV